MPFNPKAEYVIVSTDIGIKDFYDFNDHYVTRPPYQRKSVWSPKKKQALMDSLIRRYYIPRLVIREVRLSDEKTVNEIIDGQQRITTVQEFFDNQYKLPNSLSDFGKSLSGLYFKELASDIRIFISRSLKYQVDIIKSIADPRNVNHQITATEIFWRLQQGESLNYMEVAHAQLSSLTRNFIVKYADDQTFDYIAYEPKDENPHREKFFSLLHVDNARMNHLKFMARFIMIEQGDGYADLSDKRIEEFINNAKRDDGIANFDFENTSAAKDTLKTLRTFYNIFKNDPMLDSKSGMKELSIEYFIISVYLLIRHLRIHYVVDDKSAEIIREFLHYFHNRWKTYNESVDTDMLMFSNHRQQGESQLETRDSILRLIFFQYLKEKGYEISLKDTKRAFTELERIQIYRRDRGLCQQCLREGKPENESKVSWSNYHADHVIPYVLGGTTTVDNAQVLCKAHNLYKGARI